MSDYTPKTEMVKTRYAIAHGGLSDDEEDVRADAFDRWLSEHDRQVAERAWDDAVEEAHALGWLHDFAKSDALARNPHRAAKGEQK